MVRAPRPQDLGRWADYDWRAAPEPVAIVEEHAAFRAILEAEGIEVMQAETPMEPDPDAIYVRDPALMVARGAVLLRPGKVSRRMEVTPLEMDLAAVGVAIVGSLTGEATAEGGDIVLLDERTVLVGRSYRTNDEGIGQLRDLLPRVEVIAFDLPHLNGRGEVLHLMSLLSPLAPDLALVYLPLMPARLVELLAERGIETVEVPDDEFASMGPNVLALAPRVALAIEGNDETRRRMEAAGVEVRTYRGDEISRKGDGGPTCLTRPLLRD
jgi:N-dimethylarginine dimethylaminohydrolase